MALVGQRASSLLWFIEGWPNKALSMLGATPLLFANKRMIQFKADEALPADGLEEHWRQTYVDLTCPTDFGEPEQVSKLAAWLVRNQPISLAMNTVGGDYAYARQLFEETSQVVYTVGYEGNPALTCQARPQEGEIFGEFPVRRDLGVYTK